MIEHQSEALSQDVILYDYWRSSASYRVRIALNLAGIAWRAYPVDLVAGAHREPAHLQRHPQGLVPVLEIQGQRLTQSLAIIEYLDTTYDLGLLPTEPFTRARVRALAYTLAVDVHPVCNLSVVTYATQGQEPARTDWMRHFISPALQAFETQLSEFPQAPYCTGDRISLADVCLIPQLYNADRWGADYSGCARIRKVAAMCSTQDAFVKAHPDRSGPES